MSSVRRYAYKADTTVRGGQDVINLDHLQLPFQASILVDIVDGSASYAVEFTTDDLTGEPSAFRWWSDSALPAGQTTTQNFSINSAVTGVRLNLQSITGEVRFSVIQGVSRL
jgi:hypothetical protein